MRVKDLAFYARADLAEARFVTINKSAGTVGYTTAAAAADGVIESAVETGKLVNVYPRGSKTREFWVTAGGAIAKGASLEVGTDGKAITRVAGVIVGYALRALANGEIGEAYNV